MRKRASGFSIHFLPPKRWDRGTGLGLASAYGIVKNHSGTITVYSEVGEGTTFNIYLPYSEQEVKTAASVNNEIIKGTETILLVDDESVVIDVGKEMLEKLGYDVLTAKSGKDAVANSSEKRQGESI
jgi:two-component system cell cycle sensor histidine kinase/response regulator CckA